MIHTTKAREMANRATVTFHTSPETKERLERLAGTTRRSKSFLTNEAVARYLAEEEAFVADVKAGLAEADRGELIDQEDVDRYFGSLETDRPLPLPTPRRA
jgi:predicted transcriptional regulator